MENLKEGKPLKTFDPKGNEFKTDNHTYTVYSNSMSHNRFMAIEMWDLILVGYQKHRNYVEYQKSLMEAFNKQEYAKLGKLIWDGQMMFQLTKEGVHPIMMYCAIFCIREDEDIHIWDEEFAKKKVNDWIEHGYDITCFFALCLRVSPILKEGYKLFTQNTLADRRERTLPEN